jgi:hypothetical protein
MRTFGQDIPRLSWLGAKTFGQHGMSRKNQPGHNSEHAEANLEHQSRNAARLLTIEDEPVQPLLTDGK